MSFPLLSIFLLRRTAQKYPERKRERVFNSFYEDIRQASLLQVLYYVFFLFRRLAVASIIILLPALPAAQIILYTLLSAFVRIP